MTRTADVDRACECAVRAGHIGRNCQHPCPGQGAHSACIATHFRLGYADTQYDFPFSRKYLTFTEPDKPYTLSRNYKPPKPPAPAAEMDEEAMLNAMMGGADGQAEKGVVDGQSEKMDVPLRPEEKKRLDWREELYLAPLTTVGNLVSSGSFWGHVVRRYHTMGTP